MGIEGYRTVASESGGNGLRRERWTLTPWLSTAADAHSTLASSASVPYRRLVAWSRPGGTSVITWQYLPG
jgi:hypothetical protein